MSYYESKSSKRLETIGRSILTNWVNGSKAESVRLIKRYGVYNWFQNMDSYILNYLCLSIKDSYVMYADIVKYYNRNNRNN